MKFWSRKTLPGLESMFLEISADTITFVSMTAKNLSFISGFSNLVIDFF